jgi:hypothetical protein
MALQRPRPRYVRKRNRRDRISGCPAKKGRHMRSQPPSVWRSRGSVSPAPEEPQEEGGTLDDGCPRERLFDRQLLGFLEQPGRPADRAAAPGLAERPRAHSTRLSLRGSRPSSRAVPEARVDPPETSERSRPAGHRAQADERNHPGVVAAERSSTKGAGPANAGPAPFPGRAVST